MTHINRYIAGAAKWRVLLAAAALTLSLPFAAIADSPPVVPTATPLPQTGSIASTESGGFGQTSKDQWGGTALDGANAAPISGSVSSVAGTPRTWLLKMFNNSKDSYSVDVGLQQKSRSGSIVKSDSYSLSLAPGATAERTAVAHPNSISAAVNLRGWKKTSKSPEPTPTTAAVKTVAAKLDKENEEDNAPEYPQPPRKRIR